MITLALMLACNQKGIETIIETIPAVLSCSHAGLLVTTRDPITGQVAKIGKLIDKDLSLEMTLGVGMWILLAGVVDLGLGVGVGLGLEG